MLWDHAHVLGIVGDCNCPTLHLIFLFITWVCCSHNCPAVETRSPRASLHPKLEPGVFLLLLLFSEQPFPFFISSGLHVLLCPLMLSFLYSPSWQHWPADLSPRPLWWTAPYGQPHRWYTEPGPTVPRLLTVCLLSLFLISMEGAGAKFSKSTLHSTMHLRPTIAA